MSTINYNVSFDSSSFNYKLEKNGEEVNFPIKLDVGNTYIFKLTENLSAHPLYISSSNGSSRVDDKLETTPDKYVITNNVGITNKDESVSIKPLTDSVGDNNIFLICGNHASMGGQLVISEISLIAHLSTINLLRHGGIIILSKPTNSQPMKVNMRSFVAWKSDLGKPLKTLLLPKWLLTSNEIILPSSIPTGPLYQLPKLRVFKRSCSAKSYSV